MEDFEQWVARVLAGGDEEVAAMLLEKGSDRRYRAVEVRGAFAAWENRQHKINVLQRGVKELTARLSDARNGTPCSEVRAAQAEKERDEYSDLWRQERTRADALAAHVKRLHKIGYEMETCLSLCEDPAADMNVCDKWLKATKRGPSASLAHLVVEKQAEALEGVNAHDLSRLAKSMGKDAWDMNPKGIAKLVNAMGAALRKKAKEETK